MMLINKKELLTALEIVKPGLANKEVIEQSTSFAFMGDCVVTYNDEISISHPVNNLEITGAIKADEFYKLIAKIKQDDFELSTTENEVVIEAGKTKAGIVFQSEIRLPVDDIGAISKWKDLPENFIEAMHFVVPNCGQDHSRPVLTCVNVTKTDCSASDNIKVANYTFTEQISVSPFIIPAGNVREVLKLKPVQIAEGEGWIHFKNEQGTVISSRIFSEDTYPDIYKFLKVKGSTLTLPKTIQEVLDRIGIFSTTGANISITNNRITIEAESDTGWIKETCNMKYNSDLLEFCINPFTLKEILSKTLDCTISDRLIKFEGENWVYVAALNTKS